MERYSEYKDSGVQWLGEIPGHWNCVPLKYFVDTKSGSAINVKELDENGLYPVYGGGAQIGFCNKYNCNESEIIVGRVGAKCGCINFPMKKVWATDNALIVTSKLNLKFTAIVLEAADLNRLNVANAQPLITGTKIKQVRIALPPLSEQHSIVSYLDDKCAKIDKMLEGKQKQIELLAEMKQRIIADAVTHGLNSDVKMKATNIPWLPEIPEHWEMDSLRRFLRIFTEKGHGDKQLLSVTREQGVIERNTDSTEDNHNFIPEDLSGYKYVQVGDFVINKMKSWQGSYGVSEYEGIVSPAYFTCKLQGVDKHFFSTAIRSKIYVSFFARYSKGIRVDQWDLSPVALKSIPFALPPLPEQRAIVLYITEKTAKIDTLTSKLQQEIESIKEYKQRLISDVVTGQIKVC